MPPDFTSLLGLTAPQRPAPEAPSTQLTTDPQIQELLRRLGANPEPPAPVEPERIPLAQRIGLALAGGLSTFNAALNPNIQRRDFLGELRQRREEKAARQTKAQREQFDARRDAEIRSIGAELGLRQADIERQADLAEKRGVEKRAEARATTEFDRQFNARQAEIVTGALGDAGVTNLPQGLITEIQEGVEGSVETAMNLIGKAKQARLGALDPRQKAAQEQLEKTSRADSIAVLNAFRRGSPQDGIQSLKDRIAAGETMDEIITDFELELEAIPSLGPEDAAAAKVRFVKEVQKAFVREVSAPLNAPGPQAPGLRSASVADIEKGVLGAGVGAALSALPPTASVPALSILDLLLPRR